MTTYHFTVHLSAAELDGQLPPAAELAATVTSTAKAHGADLTITLPAAQIMDAQYGETALVMEFDLHHQNPDAIETIVDSMVDNIVKFAEDNNVYFAGGANIVGPGGSHGPQV
jgi:hypothetical protein